MVYWFYHHSKQVLQRLVDLPPFKTILKILMVLPLFKMDSQKTMASLPFSFKFLKPFKTNFYICFPKQVFQNDCLFGSQNEFINFDFMKKWPTKRECQWSGHSNTLICLTNVLSNSTSKWGWCWCMLSKICKQKWHWMVNQRANFLSRNSKDTIKRPDTKIIFRLLFTMLCLQQNDRLIGEFLRGEDIFSMVFGSYHNKLKDFKYFLLCS